MVRCRRRGGTSLAVGALRASRGPATGTLGGCAARARSHHLVEQIECVVLEAKPGPAPSPGRQLEVNASLAVSSPLRKLASTRTKHGSDRRFGRASTPT